MTIYSLYIYDRHCDCVYYQDWHRTQPVRSSSAANFKPGVHRLPPPQASTVAVRESIFSNGSTESQRTSRVNGDSGVHGGAGSGSGSGSGVGAGSGAGVGAGVAASQKGLPFDEEAKLVYGVVLSLRNMVKKLSGREEAFTSYRTPHYKLHLYETLTGYRFVLLSDAQTDSLRFVLRQLYTGPFVEYVVRNPLVEMDSRTTGIDNDQFRGAVDKHMRGLSMFA